MAQRPVAPRLIGRLLVCGLVAGCARTADDVEAAWNIEPGPAVANVASVARIRLHDAKGALSGATLRLEGHMSHPGMAPVVAPAVERADGVYEAPFQFTMAGDWVLVLAGTLADGRRV
jgi:hypothetical protein